MGKAAFETRISDAHYSRESEFERSCKRMMLAMVPQTPPLHILDVGCGTGLNASTLAAAGHTVSGVDVSPVAIEQFRTKGFQGYVCDVETQAIPVPDGTFDLIHASYIIEHLSDTATFLSEMFRVLKPQGIALISTTNSAFWAYRVLEMLGQTASEVQHPGHVRFFSKRNLRREVESSGFKVSEMTARHMYLVLGSMFDPLSPLLRLLGFEKEHRFATGGHFWQFSRFAKRASGFWADTLFVVATKPES